MSDVQYADDTALVATSKQPQLLLKYLETYLTELETWLRDWRIAINVDKSAAVLFTTRRTPTPRPLRFLGDEIQWVEKVKYLGVTLDKRLTWATHIDQVRRRASQRLGVLGALLNRRSGLSIRNGLTLYKQLIRPMMDYACPVWRHASNSHIRRLQVLQFKCLRIIADAPWYVSNLQLHENLEVSYLAEHIRNLDQSFKSKIPDSENFLVRQLGGYLAYPRDE